MLWIWIGEGVLEVRDEIPQGGDRQPASRPGDDPQGAPKVGEEEVVAAAVLGRRGCQRVRGHLRSGCKVSL